MKITRAFPKLSISDQLEEFDIWITPLLSEIKDTDKYQEELLSIVSLIEAIGNKVGQFQDQGSFSVQKMTEAIFQLAKKHPPDEQESIIIASTSLLFLSTGKSDNNAKCQFPIFLRDIAKWQSFPVIRTRGGQIFVSDGKLPRTIDSERIAKLFSRLNGFEDIQKKILKKYIEFILNEEVYVNSIWSIGNSYFRMKKFNIETDFLMPLVIFKVRGSVSASGGHEPEKILRGLMIDWGLIPDQDFNTADVIIGTQEEGNNTKTRAYDFVLPYAKKGWDRKFFIQCQFYAGDSGSVSHKNVDQTRAARDFTKANIDTPIFIEYLDGAGYFSSLNGDLKRILQMEDTANFFQIRTAPLKLRKLLQEICFLTPLEVSHAIARSKDGHIDDVKKIIQSEGYVDSEFDRSLNVGMDIGCFSQRDNRLIINDGYRSISRKYFLLDLIAEHGEPLGNEGFLKLFDKPKKASGSLLIPGFGNFVGLRQERIPDVIFPNSGCFKEDWSSKGEIFKDMQYLSDQGWIIQC